MPKKWLVTLVILLIAGLAVFLAAGYFLGNVPLASAIMGTNKPRDLDVEITAESVYSGLEKMNYPVTAGELQQVRDNPGSFTKMRTGLNNEEVSSLLATGQRENFPFRLVQVRFGPGGTVQTSGILYTEDISRLLQDFGLSNDFLDKVMDYVENIDSFSYYAEGTCGITNNVIDLDIESLQIGRINIPEDLITDNLGSIENAVSDVLVSNGYDIRELTISEDRVDLDVDRPLTDILPWLDFIRYE